VWKLLEAEEIKRFYENWEMRSVHREWPHFFRKEFRIKTLKGNTLQLNRLRSRLNFRVLKELCIRFLPVHIYQSVLNYASAERVSSEKKSSKAYPYRSSEYVVDVDSYLAYEPHSHRTRNNEPCKGCIVNAYNLCNKVLAVIEDNYSDIRVVFSGRQGFHIHVFDFKIEDHTHIDERNLLKSHEVARFKYTSQLAEMVPQAFDRSHITLSCDPMWVLSMPESLNAETGCACSYLGDSKQFRRLSVDEILRKAKGAKASIKGLNWSSATNLEVRPI
jgi:DNA primase catalytic subunit